MTLRRKRSTYFCVMKLLGNLHIPRMSTYMSAQGTSNTPCMKIPKSVQENMHCSFNRFWHKRNELKMFKSGGNY